jgi:hypothetical protein
VTTPGARALVFLVSVVLCVSLAAAAGVDAAQLVLTLSWTDNATDEDGFLVERADHPSGPFAELAQIPDDMTAYSDVSVAFGQSYCYRVRAFNTAGASDSSNVACGIGTAPALPVLVVEVRLDGPTTILSVTLVPGTTPTLVDAYIVLRAPDGSFFSLVAANTLSPGIVPIATHFAPISFTGEVFRYTSSGTEPLGAYRWYAALANAGTATVVGNIAQAAFAL